VIASFKTRALAELWSKGRTAKIDKRLHDHILLRLDRLDACSSASEMNLPGFDFHALHGFTPIRYTVHVNGPWCLTFEFVENDAVRVDLEQYH
jgi:toxin HigB-1